MSYEITQDGVYRSAEPLTEDDLRKIAPTVFATERHSSRSERYQHVPTIDILRGLEKHTDLRIYGATVAKPRKNDRKGYAKHCLRLRPASAFDCAETPEILLTNSHDGGSAFRLNLGIYRFVCANGIIAGKGYESASIRHQGDDVLKDVIDATFTVVQDFDRIRGSLEEMKTIKLNAEQRQIYAGAALQLRYDDPATAPATIDSITRVRRSADKSEDLWTTFNRVQEGLTRGGQTRWIRSPDSNGRMQQRRKTARPVKGMDQNTKLNQALWTLTEEMAKLAK